MDIISIYCNYCWKELLEGDRVFITSCFHLFCDICMTNKINERICPICDGSLMSKGSIYGITVGSTFDKTIQLFCLPPKSILMIAEKVIEFYNYQNNVYLQSLMYQSQQSYNQFNIIRRTNDELNFKIESYEKQLKLQRVENENDKKEIVELTEKLAEKTRQKRKLEELYLTLKENMNSLNNSSFNNIYFNGNNGANGSNNNNNNNNNSSGNNNNNNNINNNNNNNSNSNGINNSSNNNNNQSDIKMIDNNQNNKNETTNKNNNNKTNGFKLPFSSAMKPNNNNNNSINNNNNNSGSSIISPNKTLNTTYRSPSFCSSPINIIKQNQHDEFNFIHSNSNIDINQQQHQHQQKFQQSQQSFPSPFQNKSIASTSTTFNNSSNVNNSDKFSFIKKSTPMQPKK